MNFLTDSKTVITFKILICLVYSLNLSCHTHSTLPLHSSPTATHQLLGSKICGTASTTRTMPMDEH